MRKGGGEEWVRIMGGGRDINQKLNRAKCSGKLGWEEEFQETVNDHVKAKRLDSFNIRG